mgnify:CR=1 FL=1
MIQQSPTFSTAIFLRIYYALYTYNEFIGDRSQLIEDCKEMIQALDNTSDLEAKRAALNQKAEDIIKLIGQNSTETQDQDEFQGKYDSYNEDVWSNLVDKAIVNRDRSITFLFRNEKEIKIN